MILLTEKTAVMELEREMKEVEEVIELMENLGPAIYNDDDFHAFQQISQNVIAFMESLSTVTNTDGLREKVEAKEQRILHAQKSNLKDEELEALRNNLAQARIEEEKARATAR